MSKALPFIVALIVAGTVALAGGPGWACVGFGLVAFVVAENGIA